MFKKFNYLTISTLIVLSLLPMTVSASPPSNAFMTELIAGQNTLVGNVLVWGDGTTLTIRYETLPGWALSETHLHVAPTLEEIPQANGNPVPGQFDQQAEHVPMVNWYEYTYVPDPAAEQLFFAAHAVVCVETTGEEGSECVDAYNVLETVTLWAGQHIDAGTVTVATDGENLIVTYNVTEPWGLKETHLYVGTEPPSKMAPGRFPYKHEHLDGATVDEYVIPLSDLDVGCDDTLYIAAHAALDSDEPGYGGETGWGEGQPSGKGWSMYFSVTITCGCEMPCETAWAAGEDFPGNNWATYFVLSKE
jgi:hypothetical protein